MTKEQREQERKEMKATQMRPRSAEQMNEETALLMKQYQDNLKAKAQSN